MSKRSSHEKKTSSTSTPAADNNIYYNPLSKYQENVEVPGLTLFEIHREPRREDKDARVNMELKTLAPEFHCVVCLGYIKNAYVVSQCLHRFCYECIEKVIRVGKKECPSCRINIPSRRSLRPDPNFDLLIKSIHGDVESLEREEEDDNNKMNINNLNKAYAENRKRGMKFQAEQRRKKVASSSSAAAATTVTRAEATINPAKRIIGMKESPMIEIVLRRHPQETQVERLHKEYIRTSNEMTIETLKIFLGKKLSYSPCTDFQIMAICDDSPVVLPNDMTLALIQRDICDNPFDEIVLYYRVFPLPIFANG